MPSDNPVVEPADIFYKTADAEELLEQPEAEAVTKESATQSAEEEAETETPEAEVDNTKESEEAESESEEAEAESEEEELVYLDLDGEEVSLDDVRKWKNEGLMQSDYTKKTTELAQERKVVEAKGAELTELSTQVASLHAELQAALEEDSKVNLADLQEFEPEEYAKHVEKRKELANKIAAVSTQPSITQEEVDTEKAIMAKTHPEWMDEAGKPTETYISDMTLVNAYASEHFTPEEFSGMAKAKYIEAILKAAKYDALQEKSKEIKKKVKKAPLKTRTKQTPAKKPKSLEDTFYS
jgi:hypothetical protein